MTVQEDSGEEVKKEVKKEKEQKVVKERKATRVSKKALVAEIAVLNDRMLRLQADFDNFRKRTLRDRNDLYQRANEDILKEFLPVMDNMDLALESAVKHDADSALLDGFKLVSGQMSTVFAKFGLVAIETDAGKFDPNLHEAISHMASAEVPEDAIIAETRKGYMLGDKLLRASQIVVSSGAGEAQEIAT